MPQYFDLHGNLMSEALAHMLYGGFVYKPSERTTRWELTRVQEQEGPAVLKVRTLFTDGTPCRALVICAWPEIDNVASYLPSLTTGDKALDGWTLRGVGQFTEPNGGYTGFGLGTDIIRTSRETDLGLCEDDSEHVRGLVVESAKVMRGLSANSPELLLELAAKGAYIVWVFDTQRGSDCVTGLGWLGGTEHRGLLDLTFRLGDLTAPQPPVDPVDPVDPVEPGTGDPAVIELIARLKAAARAFVA